MYLIRRKGIIRWTQIFQMPTSNKLEEYLQERETEIATQMTGTMMEKIMCENSSHSGKCMRIHRYNSVLRIESKGEVILKTNSNWDVR